MTKLPSGTFFFKHASLCNVVQFDPNLNPNFDSVTDPKDDERLRRSTSSLPRSQQRPATTIPALSLPASTTTPLLLRDPFHVVRHRIRRPRRTFQQQRRLILLRRRGASPRRARDPPGTNLEQNPIDSQPVPNQSNRSQGLGSLRPDLSLPRALPLPAPRREDPVRCDSRVDRCFVDLSLRGF